MELLDKVIDIDQSPIGRTPRSNPATYTGVFDRIRELFRQTTEAKMRGYKPGRFSFNVKGGRCEACSGDGIIKIEMHFLPDVYVPCEVCKGERYNRETLEVQYKGKIDRRRPRDARRGGGRVLRSRSRAIRRHLGTLVDVGLGYIRLGQPAPTLSGGEAQRIKLAAELSKRSTGRPSTSSTSRRPGCTSTTCRSCSTCCSASSTRATPCSSSSTTSTSIKTADWVIDLGPEGGDAGGTGRRRGITGEAGDDPRELHGPLPQGHARAAEGR